MEDAEKADIHLNGKTVANDITGYFTDESIKTVKLPCIHSGINTLCPDLPFGKRTNVEWCYILGDFGVKFCGYDAIITASPKKIGFGDFATQGMSFYGANVIYVSEPAMPEDGAVKVQASNYCGSLIGVTLDGVRVGSIVLPPYDCMIENVSRACTLWNLRFSVIDITVLVHFTLSTSRNIGLVSMHGAATAITGAMSIKQNDSES